MKITCPTCHRQIPAPDINIQQGIARCGDCQEMFSFLRDVATPVPAGNVAVAAVEKREVAQTPPGLTVTHVMNDLVITRRWFTKMAFGLLVFCVIWDGMMVLFITLGLRDGNFPWPILLHLAAGIFITYWMLTSFVNSTEISVNDQTLTVRHFPLPWPGNMSIPVATIDQLYCTHATTQRNSSNSQYFAVNLLQKDGKAVVLATNIEQPAQARYIEQEIERRLGIVDRPIVGEAYTG